MAEKKVVSMVDYLVVMRAEPRVDLSGQKKAGLWAVLSADSKAENLVAYLAHQWAAS
jgi:hypothetical protein